MKTYYIICYSNTSCEEKFYSIYNLMYQHAHKYLGKREKKHKKEAQTVFHLPTIKF